MSSACFTSPQTKERGCKLELAVERSCNLIPKGAHLYFQHREYLNCIYSTVIMHCKLPRQNSLQEVLASSTSPGRYCSPVIWNGREDGELGIKVFSKLHNTSHITTPVAVVRSRPDRNHVLVLEVIFVSFLYKLMGTSYKSEIVDVIELHRVSHSKHRGPSTG